MRRKLESSSNIIKVALVSLAALGVVAFAIIWFSNDQQSKETEDTKNGKNSSIINKLFGSNSSTQSKSTGSSDSNTTTSKQPPEFTVYYPTKPPAGLSVDEQSIDYSKNYYNFALKQDGENHFFIYEQPAEELFSYQRLKVKMGTPTEIDTKLGKALIGTIGTNFVTAFKTDKNTLIIINCTALACASPSKVLLESLRINDNPTNIR